MADATQGRAVVIGASMSGLLAARVLADHFDSVLVFDKDSLPEAIESRRGVPQGRHLHVLHTTGLCIIERYFPGIGAELLASGAPTGHGRFYANGGYLQPWPESFNGINATRPLLESTARRRLRELRNVRLVDEVTVRQLVKGQDGRRITGVTIQDAHGARVVEADLVVDASGRGSRAAGWLRELGYAVPAEERITIPVSYATRTFVRRGSGLDGDTFEAVQPDQCDYRGGIAMAVEGDRWLVTLVGYGDQSPPADLPDFVAYAKSLPSSRIGELLGRSEPLDEGCTFRFPGNLRRRWDKLAEPPEGFLAFGDALCSFNPVYGQGMTVAAQQSEVLRSALRVARRSPASQFHRDVARVIDRPWALAAGADLRHPDTIGRRPALAGLVNRYMDRLQRAAHRDAVVATRFYEVVSLMVAPTGLFRPDIVLRVLAHGGRHQG